VTWCGGQRAGAPQLRLDRGQPPLCGKMTRAWLLYMPDTATAASPTSKPVLLRTGRQGALIVDERSTRRQPRHRHRRTARPTAHEHGGDTRRRERGAAAGRHLRSEVMLINEFAGSGAMPCLVLSQAGSDRSSKRTWRLVGRAAGVPLMTAATLRSVLTSGIRPRASGSRERGRGARHRSGTGSCLVRRERTATGQGDRSGDGRTGETAGEQAEDPAYPSTNADAELRGSGPATGHFCRADPIEDRGCDQEYSSPARKPTPEPRSRLMQGRMRAIIRPGGTELASEPSRRLHTTRAKAHIHAPDPEAQHDASVRVSTRS